jgi:hypothetical protein
MIAKRAFKECKTRAVGGVSVRVKMGSDHIDLECIKEDKGEEFRVLY